MSLQTLPQYETYKDSGIEWLGKIPEHWQTKKVKFLFKIGRGRVISQQELDDNEIYPVYSSQTQNNGVLGYISTYDFDCEQITWTTDGVNAGTVFLRSGKHNCTNVCGTLQPFNEKSLNMSFLSSSLSIAAQFYKRPDTNGAKIMNGEMAAIFVTFPPLLEQTAIAHFLDQKTAQIDAAIAIKEKQIALLKERKQILIQQAVTQGLDPTVPMKDSGVEWIGKIPAHWNAIKLAYIAKIDAGSTPDRSNAKYWGGDIPWIKTGEVNYSTIFETDEYISKSGLRNSSLRLAPPDTLLMAMYGQGVTRGRVAILGIAATYNQACCGMTFDNSVDVNFAQYFFIAAYKYIRDEGNESSQMNLSAGYISSLKMVVPPKKEQTILVKFLDINSGKIDDAVMLQQQQIEKLREYKTTLINSAVTGKIRVA